MYATKLRPDKDAPSFIVFNGGIATKWTAFLRTVDAIPMRRSAITKPDRGVGLVRRPRAGKVEVRAVDTVTDVHARVLGLPPFFPFLREASAFFFDLTEPLMRPSVFLNSAISLALFIERQRKPNGSVMSTRKGKMAVIVAGDLTRSMK
jgi:hypothetical protein